MFYLKKKFNCLLTVFLWKYLSLSLILLLLFSDVNECDGTFDQKCNPHAVCSNSIGGYHCLCKSGYLPNPKGFGPVGCIGKYHCILLIMETYMYKERAGHLLAQSKYKHMKRWKEIALHLCHNIVHMYIKR